MFTIFLLFPEVCMFLIWEFASLPPKIYLYREAKCRESFAVKLFVLDLVYNSLAVLITTYIYAYIQMYQLYFLTTQKALHLQDENIEVWVRCELERYSEYIYALH